MRELTIFDGANYTMKKIAIIDLGTNTFHLLIAEKSGDKANIIFKDKSSVKIGQGGITKGFISEEAFERALMTLKRFKGIIDFHEITEVYAIATSAVRNARNGAEFIKKIKEQTGIEIRTITGDQEAELIYEGVRWGIDLGSSTSLIMDIGGGSVEFIICNSEKIFWKESFEIGGQRMLEMFHKSDPITAEETQSLYNYLDNKLSSLIAASGQYKPVTLVGASGAFDTLCDIDVIRKGKFFSLEKEKEYLLPLEDFHTIATGIVSKTKAGRMNIPGMIEMRVDMIVVACELIRFVLQKVNISDIRICSFALKEGVLSKALKE